MEQGNKVQTHVTSLHVKITISKCIHWFFIFTTVKTTTKREKKDMNISQAKPSQINGVFFCFPVNTLSWNFKVTTGS